MTTTRREALGLMLTGSVAPIVALAIESPAVTPTRSACDTTSTPNTTPTANWGKGVEGQRIPDLGDGRFLNPIVPGDFPDPTILHDGDDYYLSFSSFGAAP